MSSGRRRAPGPLLVRVVVCGWTATSGLTAACSSAGSGAGGSSGDAAACTGTTEQPLIHGASQESYLGLAPTQVAAIVQLVDGTRPADGPLCSATFVAPDWVVTARHCLVISSPAIVLQGASPALPTMLSVVRSVPHAQRDIALLQVDLSSGDAGSAADAGIVDRAPLATGGSPWVLGDAAEMAGYGINETRTARALRFLVESVVGVDDTTVTVSGFQASGACDGDSGGPLLVRAADGRAVIAGVLSIGADTCVGEDTYERLDDVEAWLVDTVGQYVAPQPACGTISAEGRCFDGTAVYCEGTTLAAERCTGAQRCGWANQQAGFRCVDPSADPCDGYDSIGGCASGQALVCHGGSLERVSCTACETCRIDGSTGRPRCSPGL